MKKRKGFTLVELLAVIVILAIIMIIAIPAVLNTMETAKKKSMLTFAQKAINEAEKKFLAKQTMGELNISEVDSKFYFDIRKDLDLTSTGDYYGVVTVGISKYSGDYYEITLFNKDLFLSYSSWRHLDTLDLDNIGPQKLNAESNSIDLDNVNYKEIQAASDHCRRCNWDPTSFTDGATNQKLFDNSISYRSNYSIINGEEVCNDEAGDKIVWGQTVYTYFYNYSKLGDCDYIRSVTYE